MRLFKILSLIFFFTWALIYSAWWLRMRPPLRDFVTSSEVMPAPLYARLGWYLEDKKSSFHHFPLQKKKGTLRIGCFGDSFTYGDEVGSSADYPSLLQKQLNEGGSKSYEVLNFGAPGYSFTQTFLMLETMVERYDLDYILLGPGDFFREREITFKYFYGKIPVHHSRYVLKDGGIELLDLSLAEKLKDGDFLPSLKVLRYDRRPPAFLQALLLPGRELVNPFYYQKKLSLYEETQELYRHLFMKLPTRPIFLSSQLGDILHLFSQHVPQGEAQHNYFGEERFTYFPYKRRLHFSPLGNRNLARVYEAMLTQKKKWFYDEVEMNWIKKASALVLSPIDVDKVSMEIRGQEVGEFIPQSAMNQGDRPFKSLGDLLKERKIQSLLFFQDDSAPGNLVKVLPLNFTVATTVTFTLQINQENFPLNQGMILAQTPGVYLFPLQGALRLAHEKNQSPLSLSDEWPSFVHAKKGAAISLLLNGRPILKGEMHPQGIFFYPLEGEFWTLVADRHFWPEDKNMLNQTHLLDLIFSHDKKEQRKLSLFTLHSKRQWYSVGAFERP